MLGSKVMNMSRLHCLKSHNFRKEKALVINKEAYVKLSECRCKIS